MTYTAAQRADYRRRIHAYEDSPLWHERAVRFIRDHGNFCDACGGRPAKGRVDAHHRDYARAFTGREWDEDLRALCRDDHDQVHALRRRNRDWSLADCTDHVIELRQSARRHASALPKTYAYDPALWDRYAKAHPPVPRYTMERMPRRRRARASRLAALRHKRVLLYLLALVIWFAVVYVLEFYPR